MDNFEENPAEAIRQTLAHTISIVGKEGTAIIPGKRGNTTSTFYPSMDGSAQYSPSPATWDGAHDATAGTSANDDSADENYIQTRKTSTGDFNFTRALNFFNTSAIPATDEITSATISVYPYSIINTGGGDDGMAIVKRLLPGPPRRPSLPETTTRWGARWTTRPKEGERDISTLSTGSYQNFSLDADWARLDCKERRDEAHRICRLRDHRARLERGQ